MAQPSLARRVVAYLVLAQIIAFTLGWIITLGLGMMGVEIFATSWDTLATARAEKQVITSLVAEDEGKIYIKPTVGLRDELRRAPSMKFAVFDAQWPSKR